MELTLLKTKKGVKVFNGKSHIKTIPVKYIDYIKKIQIDDSKKRLTLKERFLIEHELFLDSIKSTEKYIYELIFNSKPVKTYIVHINSGGERYELEYENGVRIKIKKDLHLYFEEKDADLYLNY